MAIRTMYCSLTHSVVDVNYYILYALRKGTVHNVPVVQALLTLLRSVMFFVFAMYNVYVPFLRRTVSACSNIQSQKRYAILYLCT